MLETVKSCMDNIPDTPFDKYFLQYVMEVQDSMIAEELSYMLKYNVVDVKLVDRAISNAVKELKDSI